MFEIRDKDLAGRIGKLKTRRGSIETPYLFPVVDPARQELPLETIMEIGFNAIITSAYLAYRRGAKDRIHKILGREDIIVMTDSGAYQLLEYGKIEIDNKRIIEIEKQLDSDIAVILDVPTGDSTDRAFAEWTVEETLRRAKEALEFIDRDKRLWVLPIQGGIHVDLVAKSARESSKLEYDFYALGSPTRMLESYRYTVITDMIVAARRELPFDAPLHLFGAGHPMIIPLAVALGVDLFDSASYILFARDGRYMTDKGTKKLEELEYFPCSCPVCSKYDPKDLQEMEKKERTRLLALHNLYKIMEVLKETKQAIREGSLWELLEEYAKKHPRIYSAVLHVGKKYLGWIEKLAPREKSAGRALAIYDCFSLFNPYVYRARKHIAEKYTPPPMFKELFIIPRAGESRELDQRSIEERRHVVYYDNIIGIVPFELSETQCVGHNMAPEEVPECMVKMIADDIARYVLKHAHRYDRIIVVIEGNKNLTDYLLEQLARDPCVLEKTEIVYKKENGIKKQLP